MKKLIIFSIILFTIFFFTCTIFARTNSYLGRPFFSHMNLYSDPVLDGTHLFDDWAKMAATKYKKEPLSYKKIKKSLKIGNQTDFWVVAILNGMQQFIKVTATLKKIGRHCYIYVENGQNISDTTLERIKNKFDNTIYPTDTRIFGSEWKPGIDFDERITLLITDIQDGWEPGKGYIGGYFSPMNEYSTRIFPYSNEREMIVIDCYPSDPESEFYLGVVAHEFQHMIHWNQDAREEVWLNESCSQLAFYVCGYGHPTQVLAFLTHSDDILPHYAKSVVDYGNIYLWMYFLYTKYLGTQQEAERAIKALVASKLKGIESFRWLFKTFNVNGTWESLYDKWAITNLVNGSAPGYKYDDTLGVRVQPKIEVLDYPFELKKEKIAPFSTHYIAFASNLNWTPVFPIAFQKIMIIENRPAKVLWGINNWQLPESTYIPEGSVVKDGLVLTPMEKTDRGYIAQIGPFYKGNRVKHVNFKFLYKDGTLSKEFKIKIINKDMRSIFVNKQKGTLHIKFDSRRGKFSVYLVKYKILKDESKVQKLQLNPKGILELSLTDFGKNYDIAYLVITNIDRKTKKYTLKAELTLSEEAIIEELKSIYSVGKLLNKEVRTVPSEKWEKLYISLAKRAQFLREKLNIKKSQILHELLDSESNFSTKKTGLKLKDPFTDPPHSNWGYITFKLGENYHALTHLKIDPNMLEGQILQTYKLLQISLGLPNLPLPDGLGIKDYKADKLKLLIDNWKSNGGTDKEKEAAKRLYLATLLIEETYNGTLTMAEDFVLSIYDIANLVLTGNRVIAEIANGLTDVPVVGPIAQKVKYKVIQKLVRVIRSTATFIAPSIKWKYAAFIPTATHLITSLILNVYHVKLEKQQSWLKEFAVKLLGKYAFTALPRIGYIDRTQQYVDKITKLAEDNDFNGSYDEAYKKAFEDGDPETTTGFLEKLYEDFNKVHKRVLENRELSKIAKNIAQIAAYLSVVDPTVISKVIALISASTSAGFLIHSGIISGKQCIEVPERLQTGVKLCFQPQNGVIKENTVREFRFKNSKFQNMITQVEFILHTYERAGISLINALSSKDKKELSKKLDSFFEIDTILENKLKILETVVANMPDSSNKVRTFSVRSLLIRADFIGKILSALMNKIHSDTLETSFNQAVSAVNLELSLYRKLKSNSALCVFINRIDFPQIVKRHGVYECVVEIESKVEAKEVEVKILSGGALKVLGKDRIVLNLQPDKPLKVSFKIRVGTNELFKESVLSVLTDFEEGLPSFDMKYVEVK